MWTEPTMPFGQSVIVSLLGLSVVFLALICLALAIMVISKILRSGRSTESSTGCVGRS